ncbi:MAG: metallophosphoesterase [Armatimonadota bacterium]
MAGEKILIYHTTDLHNERAVFPYLEQLPINRQNSLLLDSGDAIWGSSTVFKKREDILDKMRDAGYDAVAVGNREFHYLRSIFKNRVKQTEMPFVSANLKDLKNENLIKRYIIKNLNGVNIAVTGITPRQYGPGSFLKNLSGFEFTDYIISLKDVIEEIKDKADIIIVLMHLEYERCIKIAESLQESLIFLGGHDHKALKEPVAAGNSFIFYSGSHGRYITKINLNVYKKEKGKEPGSKKFDIETTELIKL